MSYKLINANNITFNSDGFITAENIEKMPCIYADLPNGMDGEHYVLKQEPILDKIRAEIFEEKEFAYADFERYKVEYLGQDWEDVLDSLPQDDFRYGMERAIEIIDKYRTDRS